MRADALAGPSVARTLRIAGRTIRVAAPAAWIRAVLGPLAAFEEPHPTGERPDVEMTAALDVAAALDAPARDAPPAAPIVALAAHVVYVEGAVPQVVGRGVGRAEVPREGPIRVLLSAPEAAEGPPGDDSLAERLTIPALSERLRRDGVLTVHAAALLPTRSAGGRDSAWLVPATRGGGKTTLALSLRGRGFACLSDDRVFLLAGTSGAEAGPRVDPWPEAPRVGDRSLFLLPPHVAAGPRDPRTGKALVPALCPPRLDRAVGMLGVLGILAPRLVGGPGGDVRPLRGARALAALLPHALVVTDPAAAAAALAALAALLARVPAYEVEVGDDPARVAAAVAGLDAGA